MHSTLAITNKNLTVAFYTTSTPRSIINITNTPKHYIILNYNLIICGNNNDTVRILLEIEAELKKIKSFFSEQTITLNLIASRVSDIIYDKLRTDPYNVEILIYDRRAGDRGFVYVDRYSFVSSYDTFCAFGIVEYFCLSVFDKYSGRDLTDDEVYKVGSECIRVLKEKCVLGGDVCMVVSKDGQNVKEEIIKY